MTKTKNLSERKRHKWRKGGFPQLCLCCGIVRYRKTVKTLMAITTIRPYDHYKYETKMFYMDAEKEYRTAPLCKPLTTKTSNDEK